MYEVALDSGQQLGLVCNMGYVGYSVSGVIYSCITIVHFRIHSCACVLVGFSLSLCGVVSSYWAWVDNFKLLDIIPVYVWGGGCYPYEDKPQSFYSTLSVL